MIKIQIYQFKFCKKIKFEINSKPKQLAYVRDYTIQYQTLDLLSLIYSKLYDLSSIIA